MAKIVVERAPPTALPLRFLLATPAWGAVAGGLLLLDGGDALQSRWAPATLALVHVFTLGVLGNAMLGSLLQFLPAAAGVDVRGGFQVARGVHLVFNVGAACLVIGMRTTRPILLLGGGILLATALAGFAGMVLPGLLGSIARRARSGGAMTDALRPTRTGIACCVVALLVTASLGLGLLWAWTGHRGLPPLPWTDVHAAWGLLGWGLGLVASVGAVVVPMFQGTPVVSGRMQRGFLLFTALVLLVGTACAVLRVDALVLRWGAVGCLAAIALAGLWMQWRARAVRNRWLVRAWRAGLVTLGVAGIALATGAPPLLVGALLLGVAFPWLVAGMQLEIVAFLGWIELHRRCGRGVRLPPVQALLPESDKAGVFAAFAIASIPLVGAVFWPDAGRCAGASLLACHALLWWRLHGVGRRVRAFLADHERSVKEAAAFHAS